MEKIIKTKGLEKTYQLGKVMVPALKKVDIEIEEGEISAVVGPSGSGKTSLLNIIGLIDTPTAGEIYFEGSKMEFRDLMIHPLSATPRWDISFKISI